MSLDLHVVVEADPPLEPVGILAGYGGEKLQRWLFELLEQRLATCAQMAGSLAVQPGQQIADRGIHRGKGEEPPLAQSRDDPALNEQDADFRLGFVARPVGTRWNGGVVVRRHLGIGAVNPGLVEAGLSHSGLEVVRDELVRDTAEELQHPNMGADPVRQALRSGRLGIGVIRCAEDADEDLRCPNLAGLAVDDVQRVFG